MNAVTTMGIVMTGVAQRSPHSRQFKESRIMRTTEKSAGKRAALIGAILLAAGLSCFAKQDEANIPQDPFEQMPIEQALTNNMTQNGFNQFCNQLSLFDL